MSIRLIVNADDFGLTAGINRGILEAYRDGIVRSTSLMVNMPGFNDAVAAAGTCPALSVGLHLNLTYGRPVLPPGDVHSLVNAAGQFTKDVPRLIAHGRSDEIQSEFWAQADRFLAAGLLPTHIDTHHNLHEHDRFLDIVVSIARRLAVPVRCLSEGALSIRGITPVAVHMKYFGGHDAVNRLLAVMDALPDGTTEIPCHPGYVDDELRALSTLTLEREYELAALKDHRVRQRVEQRGIVLASYIVGRGDI